MQGEWIPRRRQERKQEWRRWQAEVAVLPRAVVVQFDGGAFAIFDGMRMLSRIIGMLQSCSGIDGTFRPLGNGGRAMGILPDVRKKRRGGEIGRNNMPLMLRLANPEVKLAQMALGSPFPNRILSMLSGAC